MRFYKDQKVICVVSSKNKWSHLIPNFDEALKIALGVRMVPYPDEVVTVDSPLELHYKGTCYIKLKEYPNNIFDESGFSPINENDFTSYEAEMIGKRIDLI